MIVEQVAYETAVAILSENAATLRSRRVMR